VTDNSARLDRKHENKFKKNLSAASVEKLRVSLELEAAAGWGLKLLQGCGCM
jgi:hypothetical protein